MKIGVNISINVTKIDKEKLFTGKKGKYLDATVFIDTDQVDQHGNSGMITQALKKGEKERGIKGAILGNVRVFWKEGSQSPTPPPREKPPASNVDEFEDDIPFN